MRDRFTCQHCGTKKMLQVHHKTYAHIFFEDKHYDDLLTLCKSCHKKEHSKTKFKKV